MRRLIYVAVMLLFSSVCFAGDFDTILSLPNARATQNVNFKTLSTGPGAAASVFLYKQGLVALDLTGVDVDNAFYGGLAISTNLSKWTFVNVTYAWLGLLNTDISIWAGIDAKSKSGTIGGSVSLLTFSK